MQARTTTETSLREAGSEAAGQLKQRFRIDLRGSLGQMRLTKGTFMKSGFKDPIAVKPGKTVKNPFNFDAPCYDERTSCYVSAGSHYGVGHRQPVGHSGNPKANAATLPKENRNTMRVDGYSLKDEPLELRE